MRRHGTLRAVLFMLFALAFAWLPTGAVRADVDLTGRWNTEVPLAGMACLDFVQTGSTLTATVCDASGDPFTGTIDPVTGEFFITQPPTCPPAYRSIEATAAPDGQSFAGFFSVVAPNFFGVCQPGFFSALNGARAPCGDGVLDSGEECDDGNLVNGDCCSNPCRLEGIGSACGNDGNVCTDDQCDGAGTCQHINNAAPCSDGEVCTTGDTCQDGECVGVPGCAVDHYKCYDGVDLLSPPLARVTATLSDQIVSNETVELQRLTMVCAPVDKNGEGIQDPSAHLACYRIRAGALPSRPTALVGTQFQTTTFEMKKPKLLCVPGTKTLLP